MTSRPTNEVDDEMLVAYLDGELPNDEVGLVDQTLASDPVLRERLDKLRITWDLLGDLPDVQPQRDLTQTTIAMVALAVKKEKSPWHAWLTSNRWMWLALGAALMFGGGTWMAKLRAATQTQQVLNDLPILDHYPKLSQVESVAWLEKLMTIENLVESINGKADNSEVSPLPSEHEKRLQWLKELPQNRKLRLATNQKLLEMEPPSRREQYQAIAKLLTEGSSQYSAEQYLAVLSAYSAILERIGTTERLRLQDEKSLDERAEKVSALVHREMAMAYAKKLTVEDRAAIRSWIYDLQAKWEIFSRSSLRDPDTQVVLEVYKEEADSFITDDDLLKLEDALSDTAVDLLAGLDQRQHRDVLGLWLLHVVEPSKTVTQTATVEELSKRYEAMSEDLQNEIEFLSESDARKRISNLTPP